jgi:hypothetical protein
MIDVSEQIVVRNEHLRGTAGDWWIGQRVSRGVEHVSFRGPEPLFAIPRGDFTRTSRQIRLALSLILAGSANEGASGRVEGFQWRGSSIDKTGRRGHTVNLIASV